MKKSLVVVTLAIAASIALAGCSKSASSSSAEVGASAPTTTATSAAQVKSLDDAVAYALAITPKTPLTEIDQTGKLLKQYADASSKLTAEQKSAADGFITQSQQAIAAKDATSAGADLLAAAQGVAQALSGD